MARPKVHEHERRTIGLRVSVPVHDALRRYNRETGVPMTKVVETALEEKMVQLGFYDPANPYPESQAINGNGNGSAPEEPKKLPVPGKRAVVAKRGG